MRGKNIIVLCLVFFLVFFEKSTAQEIPHFLEKLSTEDGLSSNKVNDIVQDEAGFLWVATSDGLNRFDGTEVQQYFHNNKGSSIAHDFIYCLQKLPGNKLAIGTQKGLSFYDGSTGTFTNFYYKLNNALDEFNNTIIRLRTDRNGNLWAVSTNCIFIFDTSLTLKKTIASPFKETDVKKGRLDFVRNIFPLETGDVLVQLYDGWQVYLSSTKQLAAINSTIYADQFSFLNNIANKPTTKNGEPVFIGTNIFKVYDHYFVCIKPGEDSLLMFDETGRQQSSCYFPYNKYPYVSWSQKIVQLDKGHLLFLFHNYGFSVIPISWHGTQPVMYETSPLLFDNYEFNNAVFDKQGNWWLATSKEGLQKASPGKQFFKGKILVDEKAGKQIKYEVNSTCRYKNKLWIGTYGEGFFECDTLIDTQQQHRLSNTSDDTWANFIWNIRQINDDTLWLGTQAGLFWYAIDSKKNGRIKPFPGKPTVLDSVAITTQFKDSHGLVWMGLGKSNGICYFDSRNHFFKYYEPKSEYGYPLRYPLSVCENDKGNLWFTSDASPALLYWDRNTGKFQTVKIPPVNGQETGNLYGIYCEHDSVLWLGAITSGLIKFATQGGTIKLYNHESGLTNNHITSIFPGMERKLWLITQGGLLLFDRQTEAFTNYSLHEGFPVRAPTAELYYDSIGKRLYTGGNGIGIYFEPGKIPAEPGLPKCVITAMEVNGKPNTITGPLNFTAAQNDITIHYTAIDLSNGPQTHYAYQLLGEDTGWVMAGSQRQINFSQLADGDYTFMVRSINSKGQWSNQAASIHFYIKPPFTKTAFFYILLLLAIAGIFYAMYRFRIRQIMRTEQVRNEISKDLHDEVGATLTNISLGSLLAKKQLHNEAALKQILERIQQDSQHVSESIREIIWSIDPAIDTVGEAFPRMLRYASEILEAKDIVVKAEMAAGIETIKFPMQQRRDIYLIFKEAVNNIARHSGATQVSIGFLKRSNKAIAMVISDNGIGFLTDKPHLNNGLKNMKERALRHGWKLVIESAVGTGTKLGLEVEIA